MEIYLVGGSVRDELLGRKNVDHDWIVVGATAADMLQQGYIQVGKDFPVFLHPDSKEEYALARTERKTSQGYYGFECNADPTVTLEEDLMRRDLTINAIAKATDGTIIDPYGGQKDLQAKVLRHVSPAFAEDPVRILRLARFAARYEEFTVAPETLGLMRNMVLAGEVDSLVPERVWQETERALTENSPQKFFLILRECGALEKIFPALNKLWGVPQKIEYHPEVDTGVHTMMSLQQAVAFGATADVRFATLCHDLGKGLTPEQDLPSHKGHEDRGVKPIELWCKQYRVPNHYRDLAVKVARWHLHAHRAAELRPDTILKLLKGLDVFRNPSILGKYLLACKADATGRLGKTNDPYPQLDIILKSFEAANSVHSQALLAEGLKGPELGAAIDKLRVAAIKIALQR